MSDNTGGTVTYHRADYRPGTDEPWLVWFTRDQKYPRNFTAGQGEAMGLTVPAPLVVECRGHRIELSDEETEALVDTYGDRDTVTGKLARLLRYARQDPQSDPIELRFSDVAESDEQPWPQPTADTPSDDLDFDALPIGTVLRDKWGDLLLRREGGWFEGDDDCFLNADDGPFTIVHQPAPLSPRQCLEALLAGRDDADELIEYPYRYQVAWLGVIGDAARGGA